jgi:hypothetical protein
MAHLHLLQPHGLRVSFSRGTYWPVLVQPPQAVSLSIANAVADFDEWNTFALPSLTLDVPRGTATQGGYRGLGKKRKGRCCFKLSQQLKAGFRFFGCHFFNPLKWQS